MVVLEAKETHKVVAFLVQCFSIVACSFVNSTSIRLRYVSRSVSSPTNVKPWAASVPARPTCHQSICTTNH